MRRNCSGETERREFDSELVAKVFLYISSVHSFKILSCQKEGTEGLILMDVELKTMCQYTWY
jgi:hypothetical protein